MRPAQLNINLYKGQTWEKKFKFSVDGSSMSLDGYAFKAQIRPSVNSNVLSAEMTVSQEDDCVTLSLSANQTADLTGTLVWDLRSEDENQKVDYWLYGNITINGRVTV